MATLLSYRPRRYLEEEGETRGRDGEREGRDEGRDEGEKRERRGREDEESIVNG